MTYYYGTKHVEAWPEEKEGKPGYGVRYEDGSSSWSPKAAFEYAHQPIHAMSFGHALVPLKHHLRVARAGWKGMFIYYMPPFNYPPSATVCAVTPYPESVPCQPYIALKTAEGDVVPWIPSYADMLADDWAIIDY